MVIFFLWSGCTSGMKASLLHCVRTSTLWMSLTRVPPWSGLSGNTPRGLTTLMSCWRVFLRVSMMRARRWGCHASRKSCLQILRRDDIIIEKVLLCFLGSAHSADCHRQAFPQETVRDAGVGAAGPQSGHSGECDFWDSEAVKIQSPANPHSRSSAGLW